MNAHTQLGRRRLPPPAPGATGRGGLPRPARHPRPRVGGRGRPPLAAGRRREEIERDKDIYIMYIIYAQREIYARGIVVFFAFALQHLFSIPPSYNSRLFE